MLDHESAESLRFPGSQIVRVDGAGIHRDAPESGFNIECRLYWSNDKPQGIPPREFFDKAIKKASNGR